MRRESSSVRDADISKPPRIVFTNAPTRRHTDPFEGLYFKKTIPFRAMATIAIDADALRRVECARTACERVAQIARASASFSLSKVLVYDSSVSKEMNRPAAALCDRRHRGASASEIGATLDALVIPRSIAGALRGTSDDDDDEGDVEGKRKRRRMTMMGWIGGARRASTFTAGESTSKSSRYREGVVVEDGGSSKKRVVKGEGVDGGGASAVAAAAAVTVTVNLGDGCRVEAGVKRKPPVGARVFVRADDGGDDEDTEKTATATTVSRTWTIVSPREPREVTGDYYGYDAQTLAPGAKLPRDDFSCVILVDSLFTAPTEPSAETIAALERAKSILNTDPDSVLIVFGASSSAQTSSLRPDVVVDPLCRISHKSPHDLRLARGVHVDESCLIVLARLFTPGHERGRS